MAWTTGGGTTPHVVGYRGNDKAQGTVKVRTMKPEASCARRYRATPADPKRGH